MKIAINFIIVAFFAYVTCNPPSVAVTLSSEGFNFPGNFHAAMYQDLLIHASYDSSSKAHWIHVRRHNADGFYSLIHTTNVTIDSFVPITNGKWLAIGGSYQSNWIGQLNLETGDISNLASVPFIFSSATFIDDDTIIFYDGYDFLLKTIGFANGQWIQIGTGFSVDYFQLASYFNPTATWPGNYFLANSGGYFRIYERLANATWILADSLFSADSSGARGVTLYNGNDMVFISSLYPNNYDTNVNGRLSIFKKTNNEWILVQQFMLNDLGVTGASVATAGLGLVMLDNNTLLFGVPFIKNNIQTGFVFVIQQNENGNWSVIQSFTTDVQIQFGYQIFMNEQYIVFTGLDTTTQNYTFFSVPTCYNSPIDVTCNDLDLVVDLSECQFNTSTTSSLYTINNLQCGPVTSKMNQTTVAGSVELSIEYSFSRYLVNGSCTSRITCTQPPTSMITPSNPTSVPVTTSSPRTKVSDAYSRCNNLSFVALILILISL